jgi:hypothetical protein
MADETPYGEAAYGNWVPIGISADRAFKGHFDGDGYPISNLVVTNVATTHESYSQAVGLFGYIENATLKNVFLPQITFTTTTASYTGALVGHVGNNNTIQNCFTHATIRGNEVGGLFGRISGNNNFIKECYSKGGMYSVTSKVGGVIGSVTGGNNVVSKACFDGIVETDNGYAGGVIGQLASNEKGNTISDCYAEATVKGKEIVGGLIGNVTNNNTIVGSYFSGIVFQKGQGTKLGGLIGTLGSKNALYQCYAKGMISGNTQTGGLVGVIEGSNNDIKNVYTEGTLSGVSDLGGFVGAITYVPANQASQATYNFIMDSYSKMSITSSQASGGDVGGIVGEAASGVVLERLYYEGTLKAQGANIGGMLGKDASASIIRKSYVKATIQSNNNGVGGLVGNAGQALTIEGSYSNSNLKGNEQVGGLIGVIRNGRTAIFNTYVAGKIQGNSNVGGMIGYTAEQQAFPYSQTNKMIRSYVASTISGNTNVGGILGGAANASGNLKVANVYYNSELISNNTGTIGKALTTEQMQGENARKNMVGLDYKYQWSIQENNYPSLLIY